MKTMPTRLLTSLCLVMFAACSPASTDPGDTGGSGGSPASGGKPGSGGSTPAASGGVSGSGGTPSSGAGGTTSGSGGTPSSGGTTSGSGGTPSSGGTTSPDGGSPAETGGNPSAGGPGGELHQAYLDVKCMSNRSGGFCVPEMEGKKNIPLKMGGETGKDYNVVLKVWAIVEGITYVEGMKGEGGFYAGGRGNTPKYGECGLEVGTNKYFLNFYTPGGADTTRKFEYMTPAIKIPGGSMVTLFCRDTNNHLTMNTGRGKHVIANPPAPMAAKMGMQPIEGHALYLEVVSATPL